MKKQEPSAEKEQDILDINDEMLVKTAALFIANEEIEEYREAQKEYGGQPLPQGYLNAKAEIALRLEKADKRYKRKKFFRMARKVAACFLVGTAIASGTLYFTVDAARVAVNNFFLNIVGEYATIYGGPDDSQTGVLTPEGWGGPVSPQWIPARFTEVSGKTLYYNSELRYWNSTSEDLLLISIWPAESTPQIDSENMILMREITVQDVEALIYQKAQSRQVFLTFTKDDFTVNIYGDISEAESVKIAESCKFCE